MSHKFKKDLENLINKHSMENKSNTPDFLLSEYLNECLENYNKIINKRDAWHGNDKIKEIVSEPITSDDFFGNK